MPFLANAHIHVPNKDILSWIFDHLSYDWDKPMYIDALDPSRSISARQAKHMVRQLVAGLRKIGFKRGDCLCLHSLNDLYFPLVFLAVVASGGIFVATNTNYKPFELAHHFKTARVTWILAAPESLEPVLKVADECTLDKANILLFNTSNQPVPDGYIKWTDLFKYGEEDWVHFDDAKVAEHTIAALFFSSGTTGLPKAVMLSHKNLVAQHTIVFEHKPRPFHTRRLFMLPLFHAATAPAAFCTVLRMGEEAYIARSFDLETWFQCMEKYKINDCFMVPPIVISAINSPLREKYSLKHVQIASCGAAPLDPHPQARFKALLSEGVYLTQMWGATEASCLGAMFYYGQDDDTGSVGRWLANLDVKLVDDDGNDISDYNVKGEVCLRGPTVTKGYFMNEEANRRDFEDGYWHSGDIAYCDKDTTKWYVVDRKKELIKVRGFQVAPTELEGVLLSHPDIVDCAVIGVKFGRDESELPRAYVVRRPDNGAKLSEEAVKNYLSERLVYYKHLHGGVVFLDSVPKTASGKILKKLLREQATREIGARL